jgi:hypothetical protein
MDKIAVGEKLKFGRFVCRLGLPYRGLLSVAESH